MPTLRASRHHVSTVALASLVLAAALPLGAQTAAAARVGPGHAAPIAPSIGRAEAIARPLFLAGDHRLVEETEGGTASIWKHLGVGFLVGAGVGLAVGLYGDITCDCDYYVPATVFTLPGGAVLGTVLGAAVRVVRQP